MEAEWRAAKRKETSEAFFQGMLKGYKLTVEVPSLPPDGDLE